MTIGNKRFEWVDICKGLLIFLMVFAHTPTVTTKYIYAFHLAGFFFLSGFTQNFDKSDFPNYIIKKAKALIIPFFIVNAVFITLILSLKVFGIYDLFYTSYYGIGSYKALLKSLCTPDLGGATWFLIVLFLSTVGLKILNDVVKNLTEKHREEKKLIIVILLMLFNYFCYYRSNEQLSFLLDLVPTAMFFIQFGNYIKVKEIVVKKYIKYLVFILSILIITYFVGLKNNQVDWIVRIFPNIVIFLLISFSGIYILYFISKGIEKYIKPKLEKLVMAIEYLGKNTLPIMFYHFLGFRIFYTIICVLGFQPMSQMQKLVPAYHNFGLCLLTAIFGIIFALALNVVVKKVKSSLIKKKIS